MSASDNPAHTPVLAHLIPPLLMHLAPLASSSQPSSSPSSPPPPPSLYPLLAPILRSRLHHLADSTESWISLLSWNAHHGQQLASHLASAAPAAAAGERALAVARGIQRTDQETLKAAVELCDWGLEVVYLWCTNDPDGEDDGWRVLELHPATTTTIPAADADACGEDGKWYPTIAEAEEASASNRLKAGGRRAFAAASAASSYNAPMEEEGEGSNDDDDDYWNMYDHASASETSAAAAAPEQPEEAQAQAQGRAPAGEDSNVWHSPSEDTYFSRYAEVVPALDCGASSPPVSGMCRRNSMSTATTANSTSTPPTTIAAVSPATTTATPPRCPTAATTIAATNTNNNHNNTNITNSSTATAAAAEAAPGYPHPQMDTTETEVAVKQHVSMSIKSLYRLAKAAGIGRDEFENIVHTELSVLSMMDEDDGY